MVEVCEDVPFPSSTPRGGRVRAVRRCRSRRTSRARTDSMLHRSYSSSIELVFDHARMCRGRVGRPIGEGVRFPVMGSRARAVDTEDSYGESRCRCFVLPGGSRSANAGRWSDAALPMIAGRGILPRRPRALPRPRARRALSRHVATRAVVAARDARLPAPKRRAPLSGAGAVRPAVSRSPVPRARLSSRSPCSSRRPWGRVRSSCSSDCRFRSDEAEVGRRAPGWRPFPSGRSAAVIAVRGVVDIPLPELLMIRSGIRLNHNI
ncbi:hypothetical protein SAMN04487819_107102 [Actinopolyspora alba]|uniref:Uncharacterized protein n=1 Tax=Actinopolyspora alba TaxID=673379 RepID=A0A1I1XEB9_9ACTN|nr:hypothetical protein SAMN04487819_107102 [Actinopolyspora alba]